MCRGRIYAPVLFKSTRTVQLFLRGGDYSFAQPPYALRSCRCCLSQVCCSYLKLLPGGAEQEEVEVRRSRWSFLVCVYERSYRYHFTMCACLILQQCCTPVARERGEGRKSLFTQTANRLGNNAGKEVSRLSV